MEKCEKSSKTSYRFGRFDEDFGLTQLILAKVHVDSVHDHADPAGCVTFPFRPRLLRDDGIPVEIFHFLKFCNKFNNPNEMQINGRLVDYDNSALI